MRIKISSNIPPMEEQSLIVGEVTVDTRYVGAEQKAVRIINELKSISYDYDNLTLTQFMEAIKKKPNNILGVSLEWDV